MERSLEAALPWQRHAAGQWPLCLAGEAGNVSMSLYLRLQCLHLRRLPTNWFLLPKIKAVHTEFSAQF